MLRDRLRRLWLLASCDHQHADRLALFSTGAEIHICTRCGLFATILESGQAVPAQPRYRRRGRPLRERVEHYDGRMIGMADD